MYDHIGLKVKDIKASVRFYQAVLGELGHALLSQDESSAGFKAKEGATLWLAADGAAHTPLHLAFTAPGRAAVESFYRAGLKSGGRDNGAPGLRRDYSPTYYAAFLLDPDGNNVEAVYNR